DVSSALRGRYSQSLMEGPIMIRATSIKSGPSPAIFGLADGMRAFPIAAGLWRELLRTFFDPYRPELHYMRAPGPKWRERHGVPEADPRGASVKAFQRSRS